VKSDDVKEFEVEHVEAGRVELRDLHLLQEGLTQDANRDSPESEEHRGEVLEHKLAHFDLPEELDEQECESFVDDRSVLVPLLGELFHQSEKELQGYNNEGLAHVSARSLEDVE